MKTPGQVSIYVFQLAKEYRSMRLIRDTLFQGMDTILLEGLDDGAAGGIVFLSNGEFACSNGETFFILAISSGGLGVTSAWLLMAFSHKHNIAAE